MIKISACMVAKNEDRFIWYSISSVLPYVDRFIIYDTGSSDKTVEIIRMFRSSKIIFHQKNAATGKLMTLYRQEQFNMIKNGWIWVVDADEVYSKKTSEKILELINKGKKYVGIIVHRYDLLGDIYHRQDESVGTYNQFGVLGHYVLRCINKDSFPKLQVLGEYPREFFAIRGVNIKNKGKDHFAFVEDRIFHAMYLQRSTSGGNISDVLNRNKYKIELGNAISKNSIPEVFFGNHPAIVPNVTGGRSFLYLLLAFVLTPVKKIKRFLKSIIL